MGSVYAGRDVLIPDEVAAVKVLRGARTPQERDRFIREIQALRRLCHPNIVEVRGWGESEHGELWIAMELVRGEGLSDWLRRAPIPASTAVPVFQGLASGLAHAHRCGIYHRDIKPQNILVRDGTAVLVDFGVSLHADLSRLTVNGLTPGTPAYMAPEVFHGDDVSPAQGDIYALGVLLYEALTGHRPFQRPTGVPSRRYLPWIVGRKLDQGALDPGGRAPPHLRELVLRATEPTPSLRLRSMTEFAAALATEPIPTDGGRWVAARPPVQEPRPQIGRQRDLRAPDDQDSTVDVILPLPLRRPSRTLPPLPATTPAAAVAVPTRPGPPPRSAGGAGHWARPFLLGAIVALLAVITLVPLSAMVLGAAAITLERPTPGGASATASHLAPMLSARAHAAPAPVATPAEPAPPEAEDEPVTASDPVEEPAPPVRDAQTPVATQAAGTSAGGRADEALVEVGLAQILSDPLAAELWVDNEDVGRTPKKLSLTPGDHRVRVRSGSTMHAFTVHVQPGQDTTACFSFRLDLLFDGPCVTEASLSLPASLRGPEAP